MGEIPCAGKDRCWICREQARLERLERRTRLAGTWREQGRNTLLFSAMGFAVAIVMSYVGAWPTWKTRALWALGFVAINVVGFALCYYLRWRRGTR